MALRVTGLLVAVLLGCFLTASGCEDQRTQSTLPPGWATFERDSVSLALRGSFEESDPARANLLVSSILVDSADGARWLVDLMQQFVQSDRSLVMPVEYPVLFLGEPTADGFIPVAACTRAPMPILALDS
jgi:hypothetical protein